MKMLRVEACIDNIPECVDFIEKELSRLKVSKNEISASIKDTLIGIVPSDIITPLRQT